MQAVGKFNENYADIFRHGEKHASEILRLFFLFGLKSYLVELGYAQHKLAYLVAEFVAYFAVGGGRVLYAVVQKRGGKGNLYYRITAKTGDVVSFKLVSPDQDLMLITSGGVIIRLRVQDISEIGRVTSGVKLMGLDKDTKIVSIAKIREEKIEEDSAEE